MCLDVDGTEGQGRGAPFAQVMKAVLGAGQAGWKEQALCCCGEACKYTACSLCLDPVPSVSAEQHPQKPVAPTVPVSPVGDARPAAHPVPSEKPSELGASGESPVRSSIHPTGSVR